MPMTPTLRMKSGNALIRHACFLSSQLDTVDQMGQNQLRGPPDTAMCQLRQKSEPKKSKMEEEDRKWAKERCSDLAQGSRERKGSWPGV